ncbi:E3 ubiquitin-protein ligase rad18 [Mortierella sp. AM989]|nr:E3 ubiquitin-protein ligase rad18 [Mortierella sp. AM989]
MRRNVALDEIANSFKDCRTTNKASSEPSSQDVADTGMELPSISDDENDNENDDDFIMPSQESVQGHKGKNNSRSTSGPVLRPRGGHSTNTTSSKVPDSPPELPLPSTPPNLSPAPSSAPATPTKPKIRSLVACPICQMGVPEAYTNIHLDKFCLSGKKDPAYNIKFELISAQASNVIELYERQGTSTQNIAGAVPSPMLPSSNGTVSGSPHRNGNTINMFEFTNGQNSNSRNGSPLQNRTKQLSLSTPVAKPAIYPESKRIPKLTYSVLNDKQLRKKLQELGLASHGDKQLMQKRHAEYVTIFNANCDATRPQTPAQLMRAMDVWERTYEQDLQAKRKQQQELAKRQEQARNAVAAAASDTGSATATGPLSQPSSQNGSSSSSTFIPNQSNNTEVAATVAAASAFAHVLKYADDYAELIADIKRREQADKEKALADKLKADEAPLSE